MSKQTFLALCVTGGLWLTLASPTLGAPESTRDLVEILQSDASVEEKAIACRKLGESGTPEAVPALASLLDHDVLGAYARSGLERIPDPSAPAALRAALETTEGERRIGVISSLAALQDEKAVGRLIGITGDDDDAVAHAALLALGRVATPEALAAVRSALASGRDGAGPAGLLAAEQLWARGRTDEAMALYDAVRAADVPAPSRLGATRGAILTRGSVPFLIEQLRSDDPAIREVALLTLREMPSSALADALHAELASATPDLRVQLILALKDCHNPASFAVVRTQLGSDSQATRLAALTVASTVGHGPELATTLLDVVQARRSPEERQAALDLLARMEGGEEVDVVILKRLRQARSAEVREDTIRILGDRRSPAAVDDLLDQARDENPEIRVAALRAMRRMVGPQEVPALISLIEAETEDSVRMAAVPALVSACGDDQPSGERVLAELKRASDPDDRDVWTRVVTAVGYSAALPTVLAGLDGDDPQRVTWTITRLGEWPDPAPIEPLLAVMESSPLEDARRRACSAVIRLTTNAADQRQRPDDVLMGWFGRADAAVETVGEKRQLLSGIARVHTVGSLRLLEPYLEDPEVRGEALYALLAIGSPLVKAGQHAAVGRVLPEEATIQDQELRWRIERLRQQVDAAR